MTLVGTSVERVGARAKVTGAVSYIADMEFPCQLWVKSLRSPYAKLVRNDAARAAAFPGVRAMITRDDLADLHPYFGTGVEDQPVSSTKRATSGISSRRLPPTAVRSQRRLSR